jgi:hypothetical protein
MTEALALELRRFGDVLDYRLDGNVVVVRGRHFLGSRYELRFPLAELRREYHTYWMRNTRAPVLKVLAVVSLVVLCALIGWSALVPTVPKQHGGWLLAVIGACLASLRAPSSRACSRLAWRWRSLTTNQVVWRLAFQGGAAGQRCGVHSSMG